MHFALTNRQHKKAIRLDLTASLAALLLLSSLSAQAADKPQGSGHKGKTATASTQSLGYVLKMHTRAMGFSTAKISNYGFWWESSLISISVDGATRNVTMINQETLKCFTFPSEKFRYYLGLMGFSEFTAGGSAEFLRNFKFSPWIKTKRYKVGDLDLVGYERHVVNPPPGRTRTQTISVVDVPGFPSAFSNIYNEVTRLEAGTPTGRNGLVAENYTRITNPDESWATVKLDSAKKTLLSRADVIPNLKNCTPVHSMSELFVSAKDSKQDADESSK